jgi:hypothetical protein
VIVRWSGREAHALRQAMRLSIDDFARHAEVSPRSVARWAQRGAHIRLRWDVQRLLDGVLSAAGPQVQARLGALLSSPLDEEPRPGKVDTHRALTDALLSPSPPPAPLRLIHLEQALARVHMAVQSCHYVRAAADLAGLMHQLCGVSPPERGAKLAADACRLATDLLLKLDDLPMAMLAAQRAEHLAQAAGQPVTIAAATRATVSVLTRCGRSSQAAMLARGAADRLATATGPDGPRPQSGYGALLLGSADAHAADGEGTEAMALLGEAAGIASRLGEHANYGWTAFDPANVALHRMGALLRLGEPGLALHVAQELDPQRIRLPERRAAWHLGTARACHTLGRRAEARAALRHAAGISPTETDALAAELAVTP